MWITILKTLLMALAEESVKKVIKETIKDKLTSKSKTDFDDGLVDVIFDSKSKGDLSRNIIGYGANSLLNSVNETIDNKTVNNFLTISKASKGNGITNSIANGIKIGLDKTKDKLFYKDGIVS